MATIAHEFKVEQLKVAGCALQPADQEWLANYGVDPAWQFDQDVQQALNETITLGSLRLDEPVNQEQWRAIVGARMKFMEFVGLDVVTFSAFQCEHPTIIPLDTFVNAQRLMIKSGLDAAKVINAFPTAITYAPESIRGKVANLTALRLDAAKVINAFPTAIGYAPESVREKVRFLDRSINLLRWEHSTQELIDTYPALLGFNIQKLAILRRIAARHISESSRSDTPSNARSALIVPLEKYIIQLAKKDTAGSSQSVRELSKSARNHKLNTPERRAEALETAKTNANLGRIGTMYLRYRG